MRPAPIAASCAVALFCVTFSVFAGQGIQRLLYTIQNNTFIENPSGDSVVTNNDVSGSIASVQASLNSARSAHPNSIIVINLLNGGNYTVSNASLVLGSHECLVAFGATIQAASPTVSVPLIQIASGATNVSIAGGVLNGAGANINAIQAPLAGHVNVDRVIVRNCGLDGLLLNGNGTATYDSELTVTRCDVAGIPTHAGINIQNATQPVCTDNNCHNNFVGISVSAAWGTVANNACWNNATGIAVTGGDDVVVANNTCNNNATGISSAGTHNLILSNSTGTNSTAGISSIGAGNVFADNLFTGNNGTNFFNGGSGDNVIAFGGPMNAPGQNYFYPPLINDQHSLPILNGMGRTDLTIGSDTIEDVQSQYNAAQIANPNNVIVMHLTGTYVVGANALMLASNTCILLSGTIQMYSATTASNAITAVSGARYISISGGIIDGGNPGVPPVPLMAIYFPSVSSFQIDAVTVQHFGTNSTRVVNSDAIRIVGGGTPRIITRCTVNGCSARGIWIESNGPKAIVSDTTVTDVQMDGVDFDATTSGSVAKFNYLHDNSRCGVFIEQSAAHNLALGNICNNNNHAVSIFNNSATPRASTACNTVVGNMCLGFGRNLLQCGSTGTNVVTSTYNFFFNNVFVNGTVEGQNYGSANYFSQNYMSSVTLTTTPGVQTFFNSLDGAGYGPMLDSNSRLNVLVNNAATSNNAPVGIGPSTALGNDQWNLVPVDTGYYEVANKKSGMALAVQNASLANGALIVQNTYTGATNQQWLIQGTGNGLYNLANRLSGRCLDVPGGNTNAGTQLDQQPLGAGAGQQFDLLGVFASAPLFPPWIGSAGYSTLDGSVTLSGNNGPAGWPYHVLAATNIAVPLSNWTVIGSNAFDSSGNFIYTNYPSPDSPQQFYRLQVP
jgi:hypothetical protein